MQTWVSGRILLGLSIQPWRVPAAELWAPRQDLHAISAWALLTHNTTVPRPSTHRGPPVPYPHVVGVHLHQLHARAPAEYLAGRVVHLRGVVGVIELKQHRLVCGHCPVPRTRAEGRVVHP